MNFVCFVTFSNYLVKSNYPESRKWTPLVRVPAYNNVFYEVEGMTHPVIFVADINALTGFSEYLASLSEISLSDDSTRVYAGLDIGTNLI
jgi:hypothetical protein